MSTNQNTLSSDSQPITAPQIPRVGFRRQRQSRKPLHVQQAIIAKAMLGESNSQISRDLDVSRGTVISLLAETDIRQHVSELRSDMVLNGDLVKSVRVMRRKLNKGSESAATTILRGFNVLQSNPKVEVNIANFGAQNFFARRQQQQIEQENAPVEAKTINVSVEQDSSDSSHT